jgi:hypothetical protein
MGGGGMGGMAGEMSGASPAASPGSESSAAPAASSSPGEMEEHMKGMGHMHSMMQGEGSGGMPMEHGMEGNIGQGMGGMGGAQPQASPSGAMDGGMRDDM